jgi:DNA-binding NtrC family response regulator
VPKLTEPALIRLQGYDFPGNVRELKNLIEHALLDSRGKDIHPEHLHLLPRMAMEPDIHAFEPTPGASQFSSGMDEFLGHNAELPLNLEEAEILVIKRAVAYTKGNVAAAARLLGTNRTRIYRTLHPEKYKLSN